MSVKWTGNRSESGILRKSEFKEKKEELFVFGYSCKLFRDNEKALHIDQGKHLIPWMGDETLKIDRYDARGALHDLSNLEAPPGGYDWRVELTRTELDVEQLCDEERYRALHTDEDEEEMYKEEELKRLHAAGYGQVGFNYDTPQEPEQATQPAEVDEPFEPTASFKALLPPEMILPDSLKQNAIIEKTAKFIAAQGAQMEILIKAKQGDNPQFQFLNKDCPLNAYYSALIGLIKSGKWPEKIPDVVEEKPPENEDYLHPSLASTIIESAPSIPSIHYKPSADCDYTMLISKMRGEATLDSAYAPELAPGEVAPPGTEPLPPRAHAEISRAPVMYNRTDADQNQTPQAIQAAQYQQYAAYYQQYMAAAAPAQPPARAATPPAPGSSTGLSLMRNYNTDSGSDDSDYEDSSSTDSKEPIATPPEDVQVVIDKMAEYVARNGDEFAEIVRSKNDPRFTFLEPTNVYHAYYKRLMQQKRGIDVNGKGKDKKEKSSAPVSFSIKKLKEPDPILPKPALPYESSSDEESEKAEKTDDPKDSPKPHPQIQITNIPPVVVYKIENPVTEILPVKVIEPVKVKPITPEPIEQPKPVEHVVENNVNVIPPAEVVREKSVPPEEKPVEVVREKERDSPRREKRKHRDRKKEYRSKSESRETKKPERSVDREKRKEKDGERERKRRRYSRDELESEIISLVDNTDDLIDLTGDQSDSKCEVESEADKAKQQERRRRAAEFLKKVGVDPSAAALPTSSLASAMVDTLESLRKKKAEDEKRRKREKRRHRERYEYEDSEQSHNSHRKSKRRKYKSSEDEESDYDGRKKKKKKDKKHSSKSKKRRRHSMEVQEEEEEEEIQLSVDLTSTLKELRHASPTRALVQDMDDSQHSLARRDSSAVDDRGARKDRKKKKEDREYSEGEWSSDSEQDSGSSVSGKND